MISTPKTPGVYITELNAFSNSVAPIATAVPAFIGYTPRADYRGASYYNKAVKITSFAEFQAYFLLDNPPPPAEPARQYSPAYHLVAQNAQPDSGQFVLIGGTYYSIVPDPSTVYYLYNSIRLFYQNGGGDAYVVAVGAYGAPSHRPASDASAPVVNPNVHLVDLQRGLSVLLKEAEPTLYICPEATLLTVADNGTLMRGMLEQAEQMGTALCVFDIIGADKPDPVHYTQDIQTFRGNVGQNGLSYGACYYPFIGTHVMQPAEMDFTQLFGGDTAQLAALINPPAAPNVAVAALLDMILTPPAQAMSNSQLQAGLLNASQSYRTIIEKVLECANVLPPSGAMAGVYAASDNSGGVWSAPANRGIVGAVSLPIQLSDAQQEDLNIDADSGKSVNAIRSFKGAGILIWGARTLDGNSQDWRYIPVRRTMIFLEQSIKLAAQPYVFQPNTADTWGAVKAMITSFLTGIWKAGGLRGATPDEAFHVSVGLGSTMTPEDLLDGYLRISVQVAVMRPAEFLTIAIVQEQAKSD